MNITGLFETHLMVRDLDRSIHFYRDVLHLPFAYAVPERNAAFLWIGAPGTAMLGLWASPAPIGLHLHLAFQMPVTDIIRAVDDLRAVGITPRDFNGASDETPCVIGWMPAIAVYFSDPDGHSLEFISMLPDQPRPEIGVVTWPKWQALVGGIERNSDV
ncbi:MAG: VOC family protein [Chloroflexota bacterium]|nr:VOC family protein [Chloroflexota bacterium]